MSASSDVYRMLLHSFAPMEHSNDSDKTGTFFQTMSNLRIEKIIIRSIELWTAQVQLTFVSQAAFLRQKLWRSCTRRWWLRNAFACNSCWTLLRVHISSARFDVYRCSVPSPKSHQTEPALSLSSLSMFQELYERYWMRLSTKKDFFWRFRELWMCCCRHCKV